MLMFLYMLRYIDTNNIMTNQYYQYLFMQYNIYIYNLRL